MEIILVVLSGIMTTLGSFLIVQYKSINQRIRFLEESYLSKRDVRQLIEDKIGGIHSDLRDIKAKIDKLFDLYLQQK